MQTSFYGNYFTQYIESYCQSSDLVNDFNEQVLSFFREIKKEDCYRWESLPMEYLSYREAIALGIYLKQQKAHLVSQQTILSYFEYAVHSAKNEASNEINFYALMAIGIFYFEQAIKCPLKKKEKILKICDFYFSQAESEKIGQELLLLHRNVVELAKGDKVMAIKYLVQASKVSSHPQVFFAILAELYLEIGSERVSKFYSIKAA